jgi:hypothetical protein
MDTSQNDDLSIIAFEKEEWGAALWPLRLAASGRRAVFGLALKAGPQSSPGLKGRENISSASPANLLIPSGTLKRQATSSEASGGLSPRAAPLE